MIYGIVLLKMSTQNKRVNSKAVIGNGFRNTKLHGEVHANKTGLCDAESSHKRHFVSFYYIPVSYTHLDVYKRQDLRSARGTMRRLQN